MNSIPELTRYWDFLKQPIFVVRERAIEARNPAAQALTRQEGSIAALIHPADLSLYETFDGSETMELELCLDGRIHRATVHRDGAFDLFIADEKPLYDSLSLDTLAVVGQAVRVPLTDLFDVASVLFPMLEEQEDPRIQKQTARLNKSFYQLLRLAGNLSDAGRFIAGERRAYLERTDLYEFFGEIYDRAEPMLAAAGVTLLYKYPSKRLYGSVDRQKLERAILNLLSNALKFTPRGGTVTLELEAFARGAMVRVADSGEGMDPQELAALFDRYEHRDQLGDPRWGVGLGMPLVRYIANLHGGTVVVTSTKGQGTTVTMSLSCANTDDGSTVRSPLLNYDYAGCYDHTVVELSDSLPGEVFDSMNIN